MRESGRTIRHLARAFGVLVLAAIALQLTGHPVVAYASSGSMEPTIRTFDVFFVDPFPRHLETGDIIVFDSFTRGGPAVHRIVGGDSSGWYTHGDANTAMDQLGGEPLVTLDKVRGRVVTGPDGTPILLEGLGIPLVELRTEAKKLESKVGGPLNFRLMLLGILALALFLPGFTAADRAVPDAPAARRPWWRSPLRRAFPRGILGRHVAFVLLSSVMLSGAVAAAKADTQAPMTVVVVEDPRAADGVRALANGETAPRDIRTASLGFLPTLAVAEPITPNVRILDGPQRLEPRATTTIAAEIEGAGEPGVQREIVEVWRYPAILPDGATLALHDLAPGSPYLALSSIFALLGGVWFNRLGLASIPVGRWLGLREEWL